MAQESQSHHEEAAAGKPYPKIGISASALGASFDWRRQSGRVYQAHPAALNPAPCTLQDDEHEDVVVNSKAKVDHNLALDESMCILV